MNSREVIRRLEQAGWFEVSQAGSHKQFKHPVKPGCVTVPFPERIFLSALSRVSKSNLALSSVKRGIMEYIAYLHKDRNSDYGVSFPDFPGCITAGSTLEEAHKMAAEALGPACCRHERGWRGNTRAFHTGRPARRPRYERPQ